MRDRIFIRDLTCQAVIGVLPEERTTPQTLCINIELETDTSRAAATGDLAHTIDYARVAVEAAAFAVDARAQLLETLADELAQFLLSTTHARAVTVSLDKPAAVAAARTVGVTVYRER